MIGPQYQALKSILATFSKVSNVFDRKEKLRQLYMLTNTVNIKRENGSKISVTRKGIQVSFRISYAGLRAEISHM